MTLHEKRKDMATEATGRQGKKKKQGNEGRWKTPHQMAKASMLQDGSVAPGDVGIWVTCARSQERRAAREVTDLFQEYAEIIYGVKQDEDGKEDGDSDGEDIEAAVKRELESMKAKGGNNSSSLFTPVKLNVDCLLFVKTKPPVEPVDFVKRICEDARSGNGPKNVRSRYVNRLTPVVLVGRATEQAIVDVATKVLSPWFDLSGKRVVAGAEAGAGAEGEAGTGTGAELDKSNEGREAVTAQSGEGKSDEASNDAAGVEVTTKPYSFAIRPSIRSNNKLKQLDLINRIASLINNDRHKVNLTAPEKVILVDIYQNVCGMSVVDGDWDDLKKYNLSELQILPNKQGDEGQ